MRNRFDKQLAQLNTELITMGALCEDAISSVAKYLIDNDESMKANVFEADRQIDQKERYIESMCMKLIPHQQPVARDLRVISAALKMISDMERIGDQASDIAEIAEYVTNSSMKIQTDINEMAVAAIKMVTDSIESFVKNDVTIAMEAIKYDDVIDELFVIMKNELIQAIQANEEDAEALVDLLMIAKYFERIGDHAENIAEWVIYSITGKHVDCE